MALKLSLKPGERFVINGAVIANGDRRSSLILHNRASILREKDIMQEHEADSPPNASIFRLCSCISMARTWNIITMNLFCE